MPGNGIEEGETQPWGGLLQVLLTPGRHEEHLEEQHEEQHPSHSLGHCSATSWSPHGARSPVPRSPPFPDRVAADYPAGR